ncbi:N(5)-(carboxyethyl)ornithine synthase [Mycetocola spongiae]|uniref:N(5)-(carboxyethyl)ornithine synthase n=1 Tax=Mycetocola spongiae TaxID=2859226 RepID=UPI001CF59168|nr:N(5)-(carboxyethyl)ornithine synthase [Mycetocola spongiae]UCR88028.1 N(5)-(carboxyethyl)ornithine synthase [Mycetocola spongiae]
MTVHSHPALLGVIGRSGKTDERRLPLHPEHFERIDPGLRARMIIETGYGAEFGLHDADLRGYGLRVAPREELIAAADIILLPKPQAADLRELRPGQVLWGWPHCVQDPEVTQIAIDRRLTLIAFEAMYHGSEPGGLHVFHKNNELAGYSSVLHALSLIGVSGDYGRRLSATVIGFGSTARGAVTALKAQGIHDVRVLTHRRVAAVAAPIHSAEIFQFDHDEEPLHGEVLTEDAGRVPLAAFLAESDIVVNCILQDPNSPLMFLEDADLERFRPGSLIVDVSCDEGMGFSWARPTSFRDPMFRVGSNIGYYAVDHSPSWLWNSATWEISEAVLPFLDTILGGPEAWAAEDTVARAIEIRDGVILNPAITEFQNRSAAYPHPVLLPVTPA